MLFNIFIFFKFLGFGKSNQKNIYLNQRHYLKKFNCENIKNKKSQNNAQIALNLTWEANKELSSEYERKTTYELSSLKRAKLTPLNLDI
ncbi:hypothetical protein PTQ35_05955 [Campylobacter sp. 46490-21]|uniref:hypothetical protein n=1 Tax=Campylobacter magnus TaxID=3026462 RepID=UPI00235F842A|nr:hypothetical protein [Campylobacter magnus]MDD0848356.1 hypothetical protein [Campylobacter magnus]